MQVTVTPDRNARLEVSESELRLIHNALNEVCNGVHIGDWEFETRLGEPREAMERLLAQTHAAVNQSRRDPA